MMPVLLPPTPDSRPTAAALSAQASCLYTGTIRHRRFGSHARQFCYRAAYLYLDLDELETLFDRFWLWSAERANLASFRREDHLGDPAIPLAESVRKLVAERLGRPPRGPIRLLTQPRFMGYVLNPISLYYCHEPDGETLNAIVAEVTNTPWGERHCYVIDAGPNGDWRDAESSETRRLRAEHIKAMHVSPFLPMGMRYSWTLSAPAERLSVQIDDYEGDELRLDATLLLGRRPITSASLAGMLLRYPGLSMAVTAGIYWQALQLWWRGVPFVPHPRHAVTAASDSDGL